MSDEGSSSDLDFPAAAAAAFEASDSEGCYEGAGLNDTYEYLVGEEQIDSLPSHIPANTYEPLGAIADIVERMVLVRPADPQRILDLDVLVTDPSGRVLGKLYEIFGPVEAPLYSILLKPFCWDNKECPIIEWGTILYYPQSMGKYVSRERLLEEQALEERAAEQDTDEDADRDVRGQSKKSADLKRLVLNLSNDEEKEPGEI